MKRPLWIALLAAAAFVAIVLARMPAAWVVPARGPQWACASLDGSLWSGTCAGLTLSGTSLGDLSWELHPLRLAAARLAARLTLSHGPADAAADVELTFGQRITARNLVADLPLDAALLPPVPPNLHGRAHAALALVQVQRGVIREIQGRIEVRNLEERSGNNTALGSYSVSFPGGSGDPVGTLRDLEGPLALEGTLRLTPAPGFELEGLIAARRDAPPELVNSLRFLGSPDATGRRPFSLSGTF
ncbi:MAG TPA: type II secretion system protein N [Steroidobacteraceae bacterium]|nr:type II secretion system protein N [Steroidobacteraceae bacterium]